MKLGRALSLAPEAIGMSLTSLLANRLRSLLATAGVTIGVMSVVTMASIIQGFNHVVVSSITSFGSHVLYVRKVGLEDLFNPTLADTIRHRRAFTLEDRDAIVRQCPDVRAITVLNFTDAVTASYRGKRLHNIQALGVDPQVQEVNRYDPASGRFFTEEEVRRSAQVVVLGKSIREALFSGGDPIGKDIHINGVPFRVVGELEPKGSNLFGNFDELLTVPYTTLEKFFPPGPDAPFFVPKRGEYYFNAAPVTPERSAAAIDQIREVLRRRRHVSARGRDNFAVFTEAAFTDLYGKLTGAIYLVMLLISSIALLVGGIGVMNIMLVSVTERTREIGLRKAVDAPRATILTQFLFEAATLTAVGGLAGIALGAAIAQIVRAVSSLPAHTPLWSVLVAFGFSVAVGLFFGMYPAVRASRLDPVEALRWE
ncbi:MAG: FtsX-like permease family protein [Candidatus Eisenbacteria bacterium]|uniref:FtsX-like permease family protein n=1 Tax=Eiseniibacteriota bacterium TaxID=2212470 RepID=A0A538SLH1_UNCEI|nr:MAG: FtsX-like permease family protein [Candidatus Eisenbacteria bacterium]